MSADDMHPEIGVNPRHIKERYDPRRVMRPRWYMRYIDSRWLLPVSFIIGIVIGILTV